MANITVYIRYQDKKEDFACPPDIVLGDLLDQIAARGEMLTAGTVYEAFAGNSEKQLDQNRSLEELGIKDGDVIDVASRGMAG